MTAPDYARLRELASAATAERDARYLADCDPQVILALLDERDALLAEVAELETDCQRRFMQISDDGERIAVLAAERDKLAAVVEAVRRLCDEWRLCNFDLNPSLLCDELEALLPKEAP